MSTIIIKNWDRSLDKLWPIPKINCAVVLGVSNFPIVYSNEFNYYGTAPDTLPQGMSHTCVLNKYVIYNILNFH